MKRTAMLRLAALRGKFFSHIDDDVTWAPPPSNSGDKTFWGRQPPPLSADLRCRVTQPMVRKSYYENRCFADPALRGHEPFVAVGWDEALDLVAQALELTRANTGSRGIFGGSSAEGNGGQMSGSQESFDRFLRCVGPCTRSVGGYSCAAAEVLLPHVSGATTFAPGAHTWSTDAELGQCKRIVYFGANSTQLTTDATSPIPALRLKAFEITGTPIVNISPIRDRAYAGLRACWLQCKPNSEVAIMLALVHTLVVEDLYEKGFTTRHCVGFETFVSYVMGESDGIPKDASWAQAQSGLPALEILMLARLMAAERCLIEVSASVQNTDHGEHAYWAAIALASALGYIGLPGGGLVLEGGAKGTELSENSTQRPSGNSGHHEGAELYELPLSRLADMLESPMSRYTYNGAEFAYPDVALLYWVGSDPLRLHQDLNRLRAAWRHPEAVVVQEAVWTATARYADIVLPSASAAEYATDRSSAIWQFDRQFADAWNDQDIFSALADRLGFYSEFTGLKDAIRSREDASGEWGRNDFEVGAVTPTASGSTPGFRAKTPEPLAAGSSSVEQFRIDPVRYPLSTPSGKIEIFSETIAGFGCTDCAAHPAWYESEEWLGSPLTIAYPFHLMFAGYVGCADHHGNFSAPGTEKSGSGLESITIQTDDARRLGIASGDTVRVFNLRGSFMAHAAISNDLRQSVMQISADITSSFFEFTDGHGEPLCDRSNVVTNGRSASSFSQGTTLNSCLVNIEKIESGGAFAVPSSIPTVLYNVSPTAFRSASRR